MTSSKAVGTHPARMRNGSVAVVHDGHDAAAGACADHPSRTTLTASLARHAEEVFPELANISVTTDARMLSTLGYKRSSFSPT